MRAHLREWWYVYAAFALAETPWHFLALYSTSSLAATSRARATCLPGA